MLINMHVCVQLLRAQASRGGDYLRLEDLVNFFLAVKGYKHYLWESIIFVQWHFIFLYHLIPLLL